MKSLVCVCVLLLSSVASGANDLLTIEAVGEVEYVAVGTPVTVEVTVQRFITVNGEDKRVLAPLKRWFSFAYSYQEGTWEVNLPKKDGQQTWYKARALCKANQEWLERGTLPGQNRWWLTRKTTSNVTGHADLGAGLTIYIDSKPHPNP